MNHSVDDDIKHCRVGKTSCISLSEKLKMDGFEWDLCSEYSLRVTKLIPMIQRLIVLLTQIKKKKGFSCLFSFIWVNLFQVSIKYDMMKNKIWLVKHRFHHSGQIVWFSYGHSNRKKILSRITFRKLLFWHTKVHNDTSNLPKSSQRQLTVAQGIGSS